MAEIPSRPSARPPGQVCAAFPQVGFEAYHQDEVYIFRPNEVTPRHLTRCHLTGRPTAIEEMRQEVEEIAKNWNTDYVEH